MIYSTDNLNFNILSIGIFKHTRGNFTVKPRAFAAFAFRLNGDGHFLIDGKSITSSPGEILYIPPNTPYNVDYSVGESIVVHLNECNYTTPEAITLNNPEYIEEKFKELLSNWEESHSINKAKSDIYGILHAINEDRSNVGDASFKKSLNYISKNFTKSELKIADICLAANISEAGLYRRFIKHLGESPKEYIIRLRLRYALEYLLRGELSIKEIAKRSGFNDEKYFSRLVKEKYGKSPSEV